MTVALNLHDVELSVVLTDDAQMQELNRVYRKKDRATDVLAFAMNEGEGNPRSRRPPMPRLLGDVIISMDTTRGQAKEVGRAPLDELTMLLAHGLLHLLGWDHATDATDRAMRAETERLCLAAQARPKASHRRDGRRTQRRQPRPRKLS